MSTIGSRRQRPQARERQRGQSLIEFAMLVPVFMILLLGVLEFGYVFDHTMTISYATREGARSGAAIGPGESLTPPCATSVDVDKFIVAAVQRVLDAPGSQVVVGSIESIRIYKAGTDGTEMGPVNEWTFAENSGPAVDLQPLDFVQSTNTWDACSRVNTWNGTNPPDSIGVSIRYDHAFITPLSAVMGAFGPAGGAGMSITDRSVMALNPPPPN